MRRLRNILAIVTTLSGLFLSSAAGAQAPAPAGPGGNRYVGGVSGFFFRDDTKQGDRELPGGQTTFTFVNLQYNMPAYFSGFGFIYEQDKAGSAQSDTHYGIKYELFYDEYYLEVAYALATQTFTGRSVGEREGTALFYGFGRRAPILGGILHFDLSLKQRQATYDVEDGNDLKSPVTRTTLVPFLGLGTSL